MRRAFIVEGHMESGIVNSICKGAEVRRMRINGNRMPLEKIAERIAPQIELLISKVDHIYVIVDRESRKLSASKMRSEIWEHLRKHQTSLDKVSISVPDRCFENWFAPFLDKQITIQPEIQCNVEGKNGKAVVKDVYRKNNRVYNEQVDGPRLFKAVNPKILLNASLSFKQFYELVDDDCWWKNSPNLI